jgi:type IV secretory pathway TraG/TraD family ATPase VirD4
MGLFGKTMSAGFAAGNALSLGMANAVDNFNIRRAQKALFSDKKAMASGYLFPGDQAGVDSAGLMDYRGLYWPENIAPALTGDIVSLGSIRNPRTGFCQKAGLPWEILNTHVAIIAPPGSGKTYGVIVPWILDFISAGGRVIANDVKGDLLNDILAAKKRMGMPSFSVTRWDPMDRRSSKCWNPLSAVFDDMSRTQLVEALLGSVDDYKGNDPYFLERDQKWLRGLIKMALAISPDSNFYDIYLLLSCQDDLIDTANANPGLCDGFSELLGYSPGDYSMAISSLLNKLEWLTFESARYITKKSDFDLETITETPGLLLIGSKLSDGDPAKAAASMMFAMLKTVYAKRIGKEHLENAWIIDEAAVVAKRISLDMTLSQVRSYKVGIAIALQDVTQLGDKDAQSRYLSNCKTFITLRDVSDATAEYYSKRLGTHTVQKVSASLDARGRQMPSTATEQVPLLGTSEIMHPPADFGTYCGIVHTPTLGSFCNPPGVTNNPYIVDFAR